MKKKMNSLKVVSIVLAVSLCASLVTACNGDGQIDDRTTQPSTRETLDPAKIGLDEPNQSIETMDTSAIETETETTATETAAPTGAYTYTLYAGTANEMTISMDINVDDYIVTNSSGKQVFRVLQLASDLGWLEQGQYTWEDAEADEGTVIGFSNWYTYSYGDHRAMFVLDEYPEDMPGSNHSQASAITFTYVENGSSANYFSDSSTSAGVGFSKHYDSVCYLMSGQHCMCSRDDAIVIAYGLWYFANNPENSDGFKTTFSAFVTTNGGYTLP